MNEEIKWLDKSLEMDEIESVKLNISTAGGTLTIDDDTEMLLEGAFSFPNEDWWPEVHYQKSHSTGHITIKPRQEHGRLDRKYLKDMVWNLKLNPSLAICGKIELGLGHGKLSTGNLKFTDLEVNVGVGSCHLDLRGIEHDGCSIRVNQGIGRVKILLPSEVGVFVKAKRGIGLLNLEGLTSREGGYVNQAWENAQTKIYLEVNNGIGQLVLEA